MRILYYDCFCGISGDMNLGALVDLGVDRNHLTAELNKLGISAEFDLKIEKKLKNGISGTRVNVNLKNGKHGSRHYHRSLKDINKIIDSSTLSRPVKELAKRIFLKIAEAEVKVHDKPIDKVRFHEVGASDSIVDIAGAAVCLDYLNVDKIVSSAVQLGGGFVKCAHGTIPIPAPATVEILKGIPVKTGLVDSETTTPTGAAILAAAVHEFNDKIEFTIEKTGYGIGYHDYEIPNALRVFLGKELDNHVTDTENPYLIETNIDDINSEVYGYLEERLSANGALDVYKTPIIMEKGRTAVKLSVLAAKESEDSILDVIFRETASAGVRIYEAKKTMLKRDFFDVETKL